MSSAIKNALANFVFWLHVTLGGIWYGLFFVPAALWPGRISFHFFLTLAIIGHQFVWGAIITPWTKRYRLVCILTTITQLLKGKDIRDPKNYVRSLTIKMSQRVRIKLPYAASVALNLIVFIVVTAQYLSQR